MQTQGFSIKKSIHSYELFSKKSPILPHLDIELTERCNNACKHCYINLPLNDNNVINRELATDEWKQILNQAAALGALSVRFTGGEPLVRKDFAELYTHTRRLGMKVFLFTNARLITEDLADLLKQCPPLKKIEISVFGLTQQSYDKMARRRGAYNEFLRGVNRLLERQIPIFLKSSLPPSNQAEADGLEKWITQLTGITTPPRTIFLDLRTRRDSNVKNKTIQKLRPTPKECAALLTQNNKKTYSDFSYYAEEFLYPKGDKLFSKCGAGNTGVVDAYGNFQMCMLLRHPSMVYDLKKGTLEEVTKEVVPHLRETKAQNPEYLRRCAKCFLMGLCEQCPGKSWSEHGTLDTPVEYLCQVAHAQARNLGLLNEGELAWEINDWKARIQCVVDDFKRK